MRIDILDEQGLVINTILCADLQTAQAVYGENACRIADEQDAPPAQPRTMTHFEFRQRFTTAEQELADELEVTFEANPDLTREQKRTLRTGYKNFYAATSVGLDNPAIAPVLALYQALGIVSSQRAAEILK